MSTHPFSQLFVNVSPVTPTKFVRDKTACTPQERKINRTWKIYLSRSDEVEIEVEAGTFSDACTKAISKVKRDTGKDDWQVDHFTPNLQHPPRRYL